MPRVDWKQIDHEEELEVTVQLSAQVAQLDLTPDQLRALYRLMLLTREVDARIRTLYLQGKVTGGVYSELGHEAIAVGTAFALRPDDVLAPMHRDLGAHLVRGMGVAAILAQVLARAGGFTGGKDNALHIGSTALRVLPQISMLGTSIPVAVGAALAAKQRGENSVALTYVGDGAVNTGDFHEGLNFAAALRLPFILIIENNQWAYSTPLSKQVAVEELAVRGQAYGMPGLRVDGNDVLAVYRVTREAVDRARRGEGPTLIEALTMRMRGHSEQDRADYVPAEMLEEWRQRDPLDRYREWLLAEGMMDRAGLEAVQAEVRAEVAAAADWALTQPAPEPDTLLDDVYCEPGGQP